MGPIMSRPDLPRRIFSYGVGGVLLVLASITAAAMVISPASPIVADMNETAVGSDKQIRVDEHT